MKRTILTVLIAVIAVNILAKNKKDIVLKQSEGSITFVVDKNLPAPAKHLYMMDGEKIARLKVGEKKGKSTIISTSFDDARLNALILDEIEYRTKTINIPVRKSSYNHEYEEENSTYFYYSATAYPSI